MPKKKSKDNRGRREDEMMETTEEVDACSNVSNASSGSTAAVDLNLLTNEVDEESTRDILLETLRSQIDELGEKSVGNRVKALTALTQIFRSRCLDLCDDWNHQETFLDSLERCLRKGKGEEQGLAAECLSVACVQFDPQTVTGWLMRFLPALQTLYRDPTALPKARAGAVTAVGVGLFLSLDDNYQRLEETLGYMESVFRGSYLKGDKSVPAISPEVSVLHVAALNAWALLFTTVPGPLVKKLCAKVLPRLPDLLESNHVDVRICAGETLALLYYLIRSSGEPQFRGGNFGILKELLHGLANDGTKHRAKADRRKQRHTFRNVSSAVEGTDDLSERIRFGREEIELTDWVQKRYYDSMCYLLKSGVNSHLQDNAFIRDIFDLGMPLPKETEAERHNAQNRYQRHLVNQANEKVRSQFRNPHRSKRVANFANCDD